VRRGRVEAGDQPRQIGRKILVEKQSHAACDEKVRRSRSAANAKHARMSS
jgi:hypothetical protein